MSNHVSTRAKTKNSSGGFNSVDTKEARTGDKEAAEWMSTKKAVGKDKSVERLRLIPAARK
jgi:hypothetical protein